MLDCSQNQCEDENQQNLNLMRMLMPSEDNSQNSFRLLSEAFSFPEATVLGDEDQGPNR